MSQHSRAMLPCDSVELTATLGICHWGFKPFMTVLHLPKNNDRMISMTTHQQFSKVTEKMTFN